MMNFTLMTVLLSTFSWISVSVAEFHTVESQPGKEVTLRCSNFTKLPFHMYWFKLSNSSNNSCISSMMLSDGNTSFCDGFRNDKFNMSSNTTTLFLRIKEVELSDSGLYYCGFYSNGKSVIVSATYFKVQETFDGIANPMIMVLGAVIIVLVIVVICLVVKIMKHHTAHEEGPNPQRSENLTSNDLNYAALSFQPKAKRSRRPPAEESNAVYAAIRKTQETTGTAAQGGIVASSHST